MAVGPLASNTPLDLPQIKGVKDVPYDELFV